MDPWFERSLLNPTEARIADVLRTRGWKVTKRGWPDFFCQLPDGRFAAVEVKPLEGHLTRPQLRCMRALTAAGIPCFVAKVDRNGHGTLQPFQLFRHGTRPARPTTASARRR
jgi:VRR-NUC domain